MCAPLLALSQGIHPGLWQCTQQMPSKLLHPLAFHFMRCLTHSVLRCLSLLGSVCGWLGFCNWSRKNIQILLPETKSEGHWIFPGWCVRGSYWLAFDRHDLRNLWILSFVQVGHYFLLF